MERIGGGRMRSSYLLAVVITLAAACTAENFRSSNNGHDGGAPGPKSDSLACTSCVQRSDCGANAACAQYAGDDHCGVDCRSNNDCVSGETCTALVSSEGNQVQLCVPAMCG